MREKLYIRFLQNEHAAIEWLVKDSEGQAANSGYLDSASRLAELAETATGKHIIAIIPGHESYSTWLDIPKKQARQLMRAIPFMMEDKLAQDIEQMHFATGRRHEDKLEICAIAHYRLKAYLKQLQKHKLKVQALYSDTAILPTSDTFIYADIYSMIARLGDNNCRFNNEEWRELLPIFLLETKPESQIKVMLAESDYQPDIEALADEERAISFECDLVRQGIDYIADQLHPELNLLQGSYDTKESWGSHLKQWKLPMALAAAWLVVSFTMSFVELWRLESQQAEYEQQIEAAYKSAFPQGKLRIKQAKRQMQGKMDEILGSGEGDQTFLLLLEQAALGFDGKLDVKPTYMIYNKRNSELRIDLDGKDIETLTNFKNKLTGANMSASLSSMNARDDRYNARLILKVNS